MSARGSCAYACARVVASCVLIVLFLTAFHDGAFAHRKHRDFHRHHPHHRGKHYHPPVIKIDPSKFEESKCAAMNAYFESDNDFDEMFESQFMIIYVASQRANKGKVQLFFEKLFGGKTLCEITYARRQFSWTMAGVCRWCQKWIRLQDAPKGHKWELAQYAAQIVLEGKMPEDLGLDPEYGRSLYYMNPEASRRKNVCAFRREYIRLVGGKRIGGHEFYTLPTEAERQMLAEAYKKAPKACLPVDATTVEAKNP